MVAADGQSWRRLKRIAIAVFWKLVSLTVLQSSFLLQWNDQHVTSVGQRNSLSPRQDLNLWPLKHRAGALFTWATENSWRCVWEVIGSNPVGDSDFFFVPRSWHADHFIFTFVSPSLKFNNLSIFLHDWRHQSNIAKFFQIWSTTKADYDEIYVGF